MNLHSPTSKGGLRRALRVISILLLQHALAPIGTDAYARMRLPSNPESAASDDGYSRPYLRVAGALPLRFKSAPIPIPAPAPKAVVLDTPSPAISATPIEPRKETPVHDVQPNNPPIETVAAPTSQPIYKAAPNIIPDDTRPVARPEDFLPYFRFPTGSDVTVSAPSSVSQPAQPGQLPASSATYQQR